MKRLHIRSGHLVDPKNHIDRKADLLIDNGKIAAVLESDATVDDAETLDASGQVVCPGLIDIRARLREPGQEYKATMESESRAAMAAGITHLCCPPDTQPVIDTPAMAQLVQEKSRHIGYSQVLPMAAMTQGLKGSELTDMAALADAGCVGISNGLAAIDNSLVLRRAMQYAATFGLTVFLHSQDPWLQGNGCVHEGEISTRLGLPAIPEAAETAAVARDLALVEHTGVKAHICHLSSARAVEMVADAQRKDLPVTADCSAYHLHLTEQDIGYFNTFCHVMPPLRSASDRESLRAALAEGIISTYCSDHQPHEADAKLAPFSESEAGISGLETLLPLGLRLVHDQSITLPAIIDRLTHAAATILGLDAGHLSVGHSADICIFDPLADWHLGTAQIRSKGKNTPFVGQDFKGRVNYTLLGGAIRFANDAFTS